MYIYIYLYSVYVYLYLYVRMRENPRFCRAMVDVGRLLQPGLWFRAWDFEVFQRALYVHCDCNTGMVRVLATAPKAGLAHSQGCFINFMFERERGFHGFSGLSFMGENLGCAESWQK